MKTLIAVALFLFLLWAILIFSVKILTGTVTLLVVLGLLVFFLRVALTDIDEEE